MRRTRPSAPRQRGIVVAHRARPVRTLRSEVIVDPRLTNTSFRALAFALTREIEDGVVSVQDIMTVCQIGEDAWKAARGNLRAAGYYLGSTRERQAGGWWLWVHHFTDTPGVAPTIPGLSGDGSSGDGQPGDKSFKSKSKIKSSLHAPRATAAAAKKGSDPDLAAERAAARVRGWSPPEAVIAGVHLFPSRQPDDAQIAGDLVSSHGEEAVRGAAEELARRGLQPLPRRVAKALAGAVHQATTPVSGGHSHAERTSGAGTPVHPLHPLDYYRDPR